MAWFTPFSRGEIVDLATEELRPDPHPASLIDRSRTSVQNMLDRFRADELQLVDEIADANERLRQTRLAIEAFESADKILSADVVDATAAKPTMPRAATLADPDDVVHVTPRGKVIKSRFAP